MKQALFIKLLALGWLCATSHITSAQHLDQLIAQMTIEQKVGQMTNLTLATIAFEDENGVVNIDSAKLRTAVKDHHIGSFQNVIGHAYDLEKWHEILDQIQRTTLAHQQVPSLYCIDAIHGVNYTLGSTLFPHNIGMAATRNPELVKQAAQITAKECRATGIRYNFDPVLDVGREQQWSRFGETYGEDAYLVGTMGVAAITGYEGDDLTDQTAVASCMKHFVGYGVPKNGRDRAPALIPDIDLREYHLPSFQRAIEAGASTLMVNSGEVNGVPVHASKYLLTDVLRNELGFTGVVISDWQDVLKMHERHKVAATHKEAVALAIEAGIDMVIVPYDYAFFDDLLALVKAGKIAESRIDQSVKRILELKQKVGLFSDPYINAEASALFGQSAYANAALRAAQESMTLLKNSGAMLPLDASEKVLITGPTANSVASLHGAWSYTWQGQDEQYFDPAVKTIAQAAKSTFTACESFGGLQFEDNDPAQIEQLLQASKNSATVIYCLGEAAYAETPGNIPTLDLERFHSEAIKALKNAGKRVVLVLTQGRPRIIREIEPYCDAIVLAYLPGSQGAQAIVDVLSGAVNPSGKLPFTYPRYAAERITYDHKLLDEAVEVAGPEYQYKYEFEPLYEFGHGLSFTTFEYSAISVNKALMTDQLSVSIQVKNTGSRAGKETIELYVRDLYASVTPCVKRLKKFEKISLAPGASTTLNFTLTKADLAFAHPDKSFYAEPGKFEIIIGDQHIVFDLQ